MRRGAGSWLPYSQCPEGAGVFGDFRQHILERLFLLLLLHFSLRHPQRIELKLQLRLGGEERGDLRVRRGGSTQSRRRLQEKLAGDRPVRSTLSRIGATGAIAIIVEHRVLGLQAVGGFVLSLHFSPSERERLEQGDTSILVGI